MSKDKRQKTENRSRLTPLAIVYYLLAMVSFLLTSGCASVSSSRSQVTPNISAVGSIDINSFCQKHNFQYDFDTLDDIIRIFSSEREVKLVLNSLVGYLNGKTVHLKTPPVYSKGIIYLPGELEAIVFSEDNLPLKPAYAIKTIVIDPGHGGKDPGAISAKGLKEKDLNLKVSKRLKEDLEKKGFKVKLTRSEDIFLSLQERVDIARRYDADLFISIHANANRVRSISGVEFYYLSPSEFDSQGRAADLVKKESSWPKWLPSDVKAILWDLVLTKNYALSVECVNNLYETFKKLGVKVRSPRSASFYVLKRAYVPSVLIEIGYLSNKYEEQTLRRKSYQKQISEAIVLSVIDHKR